MKTKTVIVIAEDEPIELIQLAQTLKEKSEYDIHQALNAEEAFAVCCRVNPDIIISDYNMPGENGIEFCKKIKQHPTLRKAFFLLLSGIHEVDTIVEGLDSGADDYLTKPYHAGEIRSRVNAFLRIKRLQDTVDEDNVQLEQLNNNLEQSFRGIVALLSDLMELRVPNASLRSSRAEKIMAHVSAKLKLSALESRMLQYAALLHEIGKISMPDALVKKTPGELSAEDRLELANYPIRGQLLMREIPLLQSVAPVLRHQMENYDGTGYPDRLSREEIPLGARILRIIAGIEAALQADGAGTRPLEEILLEKQGIFYDPRLLQLVVDDLRSRNQDVETENLEQLAVPELVPGMVTAHDVYTCSGKKLLSAGVTLTEKIIGNIQAHHLNDPILVGVYVHTR